VNEKKHLRRLDFVFCNDPIYFITTCTKDRARILHNQKSHEILIDEWRQARERHGWHVGAYVVMPDHVHFFARAEHDEKTKTLSRFVGAWKEWTSKRIKRATDLTSPLWQPEFFDHVLRSGESYSEKWSYVQENPVRMGLVANADDWKFSGVIEELIW